MGLFKKLKKKFKNPVKTVKSVASKAIKNPVRASMAITSGGLSELARKAPIVGSSFSKLQSTLSSGYKVAANVYTGGLYGQATSIGSSLTGGSNMNLKGILGVVGGVTQQFGANISNPYVSQLGQLTSAFTASKMPAKSSMFAQPSASYGSSMAAVQPTMVSRNLPSVRAGSLTQEVFKAGSQVLTRLGIPTPASTGGFSSTLRRALTSIASLARRTPAGTMVSLLMGLGLATYEASLLTIWHAQKRRGRRMNPANSKALRRAARRIRGFHKLCVSTDVLKSRGRSRSGARCGSCRKSPCSC